MAGPSPSAALGFRGDNPKKLDLIKIDSAQTQKDAIAGNIGAAPDIFKLGDMANQYSSDQLAKMMEAAIPGYAQMQQQGTNVIQSQLRGEIPADVQRLMEQKSAEKGVTMGTSGSGFQASDLVRNLGMTSLQLTQQGLDSFTKWSAAAPKAAQFDYTSMFQTPNQVFNQRLNLAQANLPIREFNNWVDTLPTNLERSAGELLDFIGNTGGSVGTSAIGGAMGGGGGAAAGGGGGGGL